MKSLWLALLTVREAIRKGTLLFYFGVANLIIILFAVAIGRVEQGGSFLVTFFGKPITPPEVAGLSPVAFLLLNLFQSSTQAVIFFGVFATAGLITSMLEKGTVELYLSKPLSRTQILLARSLGASAGIGANLIYFALAIWLIFGIKVGVWHGGFLLASLLIVVTYALYFSVVTITALISRSSGIAIMLSFVYWMYSGIMETREMLLYRLWDNDIYHRVLDGLYYATPQLSGMIRSAAQLIGTFPMRQGMTVTEFSFLPYVYSLFSASLLYALAARYFSRQDY